MSAFLIAFYLLLICVFGCVICILFYGWFHPNPRKLREFASPPSVPVLGHFFIVLKNRVDLFKMFRLYSKKFYPAYYLNTLTCFGAVNIVGPDDVQIILANTVHNEKSQMYLFLLEWLGDGLLLSSGNKWQSRRKILTPTFHFNILKQFIPIFNRHSKEIIEDMKKEMFKDISILKFVHKCSLHTIAETAMGTVLSDADSENKYRNAIQSMGEIIVHRVVRPWYYFRITYFFTLNYYMERFLLRYLKNFTKRVIDEREKKFSEDILKTDVDEEDYVNPKKKRLAMLDLLISAKRKNEINQEGVIEEVDTFMFEGHDTISMAVCFCFLLLACHKNIQQRVYEELVTIFGNSDRDITYNDLQNMVYLDMVIKEVLRLYPSVPLISRLPGEDVVTSKGHIIPKGTTIIIHIYDIHRIESIYPNPEKFDPDRFLPENVRDRHPYAYIPFSAGSRNCIGQRYAMLSMKTMIAATLRCFELLPIDTPETITLVADIILRPKDPIKLKLKPRKKSN